MKRLIYFLLVAILVVLTACDSSQNNIPLADVDLNMPLGAKTAKFIVIKFAHEEEANHLLVGDAIESFEKNTIHFNSNNIGLYLQQDRYCYNPSSTHLSEFAETNLNICHVNPYIELADGYYLLTWQWTDFSPLGMINKMMSFPDFSNKLLKNLPKHLYVTNCECSSVESLSQTWQPSELAEAAISELYLITYYAVDNYANDIKNVTFNENETLYWSNGMSAQTAMDLNQDWTLEQYTQFCDSMTNVYQKRLIGIITKDDLNKVGYEIL